MAGGPRCGDGIVFDYHNLADRYAPLIRALPAKDPYGKGDLLTPAFLLHEEGELRTYSAPFDHVNGSARVVLLGITPGRAQTEIAFRVAREALPAGRRPALASRLAKAAASFAGQMRTNLLAMLDEPGLPDLLGIPASAALLAGRGDLVHTSSAPLPRLLPGEELHRPHAEPPGQRRPVLGR